MESQTPGCHIFTITFPTLVNNSRNGAKNVDVRWISQTLPSVSRSGSTTNDCNEFAFEAKVLKLLPSARNVGYQSFCCCSSRPGTGATQIYVTFPVGEELGGLSDFRLPLPSARAWGYPSFCCCSRRQESFFGFQCHHTCCRVAMQCLNTQRIPH
jgi:hypothetical protein